MEEEKLKILYELLQSAAQVNKSLISCEIAMNDGEIMLCQKHTKEAQALLKTMVGDVFEEYAEEFGSAETGVNAYDIPNNLELARQTAVLMMDIGLLLGMIGENVGVSLRQGTELSIAKDINTITEIYKQIYAN